MPTLPAVKYFHRTLSDFRVVMETPGEKRFPLRQFTDEAFLDGFIDGIKADFKTGETRVAASQLVKRLGYLLAVPALFTATVHRHRLNTIEGALVPQNADGKWLPYLLLEDMETTPIDTEEFRAFSWELFIEIGKLVRVVSKAGNVPRPVLWENVAIYVYWLYEKRMAEEPVDSARKVADFRWLIDGLPGEAFGERKNPLQKFHGEKPEGGIRIRQTCCFHYEGAGAGKYCGTCPKKK
ncbi:(2Fe-2S)-binding protein [Planococcus lenghuensis]|uniref:Ferric siderophore reductase C-terminal domain-containing protein n=1 Tax=Planococcus lenghuensis TaxID=2213202 RepID=A0A1Q2L293_9BACL|nr:(2Fe-2S)-binding protein [Planococcus lenghuensis]AQQ54580.1 hypothetical protein B0X71_16705 [Planococcus lenghuensis]